MSLVVSCLRLVRARTRPLIALAIAALALATAPAALASTFAVSLGGAQAGADQDQTWAFAAAPGEVVTGLQIQLTRGYWPHMHLVAKRCAPAQATSATGCPAESRIAGVAALYAAAGAVPVPVTGYLAIAGDRGAEIAGADALLVLNPPSSAFRRTVTPVTIDVAGQNGAPVLRVRLAEIPALAPVSGGALRAPLTAIAFNGSDATSGRKHWLRNPTACGSSATISAVATLADGRVQTTTRAPNITGCSSLTLRADAMFNPKEYTLGRAAGFDLKVTVAQPAAGELRSDLKDISVNVGTGHLNLGALSALPTCDDGLMAANACPPGARVGEMRFSSGAALDRYSSAEVWNQGVDRYAAGAGGAIKLGLTLHNGLSGGIIWIGHATAADNAQNGGVSITLTGSPQMDSSIVELIGADQLFDDRACSSAPLTGQLTGWSGALRDVRGTVRWRCAPTIKFTGPDDADNNGDGYADKIMPTAGFFVPIGVEDGGDGVDWSSMDCSAQPADPAQKPATTRLVDTDGDGRPDGCRVDGVSDGDYTISLFVLDATRSVDDLVKRSFTVDGSAPSIVIDEPGMHFTSDSFFDVFVEISDPHLSTVRCGVATGAGAAAGAAARCAGGTCVAIGDLDRDGLPDYRCRVTDLAAGVNHFEITATDAAGNASSSFFDVFFDDVAPAVAPVDPANTDTDGDGFAQNRYHASFFDITYLATDDSFGDPAGRREARRSCRAARRGPPDVAAGEITDLADGSMRCSFTGLADGDWDVTLTVTDAAGNTGAHTVGVTVDTQQPVLSDFTPPDGEWLGCRYNNDPYAEDAVRTVTYNVADANQESLRVWLSAGGGAPQPLALKPGQTGQSFPLAIDCREMTTGTDFEYRVIATDGAGNTAESAVHSRIDADPPTVATTDPRDVDTDGNGVADQRFRPAFFDVFFDYADVGSGLGDAPPDCVARPAGGGSIQGTFSTKAGRPVCSFAGLPEGDVTVEISVADAVGHKAKLERGFTVDTSAPTIAFGAPSPVHTTGSSYDLAFSVSDGALGPDSHGLYVVDCEKKGSDPEPNVPCDSIYDFRPPSPGDVGGGTLQGDCPLTGLTPGENLIQITVSDPAGNTSQAVFDVIVDPVQPELSFVDAPDVVNTARPSFNFSVTNGDDAGTTTCFVLPENTDEVLVMFEVTCGGRMAGGHCDCAATVTQDLPDGKYFIHAIHRGRDGRTGEAVHGFTVDTLPPVVNFTTFDGAPIDPASPPSTANLEPAAEFSVSEQADTACALDRSPAGDTPAAQLDFTPCTLRVKVGPNAVTDGGAKQWCFRVRATDAAGNSSDSKLCFTITPPPAPAISIQSPALGQPFWLPGYGAPNTIQLSFTIVGGAPPLHTWCYFDGRSTSGMWFDPCAGGLVKDTASLGGGNHNITVVTRDALGRQASAVSAFTVQPVPPPNVCIAIYPPPPGCPGYGGGVVIAP